MHIEERNITGETLVVPVRWLISLRWWVIVVGVLVCSLVHAVLFPSLDVRDVMLLGAVGITSNIICAKLVATRQLAEVAVRATMVFDVCALSLFLMLYGGPANPFSVLYLVHIALAAVILSPGWVWAITTLCWVGYALSFWIHRVVPDLEGHHASTSYSLHLHGMWVAFVVASSLTAFLVGRLSAALQDRDRIVRDLRVRSAHQEKLAALTTLAAGAAHELSTPLGTIGIVVEDLKRTLELGPKALGIQHDLELIESEIARCAGIIRSMAGDPMGLEIEESTLFSWADIVHDIRKNFERKSGSLTFIPGYNEQPLELQGARKSLVQALGGLIKNALEAQSNSLEGAVIVACEADKQESLVSFIVSDRGLGMSAEQLKHVGEPFYTTKEVGQGLGLGVFLVQLFADRNDGSLSFESKPAEGTKVTLRLPYGIMRTEPLEVVV